MTEADTQVDIDALAARPLLASMFPLRPELRQELKAAYRVVGPFSAGDPPPPRLASEIAVLITLGHIRVDEALISSLPRLGLIAAYGAGYEGVDLDAARLRGIRVTHGPGGNASCVADAAIALLLATIMRLPAGDALVRDGLWDSIPPRNWPRRPGVGGRRLGVVGLGAIGAKIAARAAAFELEIGYHNRSARADVAYRHFPAVHELAEWADYLVVAAPANASSRRLIDATVLRALGPSGYLVNISRGSLVDEDALVTALVAGEIAGAGLDVFEGEPAVSAALRNAPNTVFTPHIAGLSARAAANLDAMLLDTLEAFFEGRTPSTVVGEQNMERRLGDS